MMLERDTLRQLRPARRSAGGGLPYMDMPAKPGYRLIAGLLALILSNAPGVMAAPRVEVFTDRDHPVTRSEAFTDLKIYRLDGLVLSQKRLSTGLPNNEKQAAKIAGERFEAQRSTLAPQMMEAGEGLVKAFLTYKLDRYPAVVFDGKAVIYGVTDLALARRLFEAASPVSGTRNQPGVSESRISPPY